VNKLLDNSPTVKISRAEREVGNKRTRGVGDRENGSLQKPGTETSKRAKRAKRAGRTDLVLDES
jgi:hypothetical protein